jgi:Putative Ig domain.
MKTNNLLINHSALSRNLFSILITAVLMLTLAPNYIIAQGNPPNITTTSLPDGFQGSAYTTTLTATGPTPISWSISSGNLPNGLSLNATTGVISGTPTLDGIFHFSVRASNNYGNYTRSLYIFVNAPVTLVISSQPANRTVQEGVGTTFTVAATGCAGTFSYHWECKTPVSPGFYPVTNGGIFSGATTPTLSLSSVTLAENGYRFRCYIYCSSSPSSPLISDSVLLTVTAGVPPVITTPSLPNGISGNAYTTTLAATGSTPITWSIITGNLPNGLSLNATTGVISGTPTADGTFNFFVEASNNFGNDRKTFSIVIASATPGIDYQSQSRTIQEGDEPTFSVSASGCTGTFSYQWQNRSNGNSNWHNVTNGDIYSGATTSTLKLSSDVTVAYNGYQYRCIITCSSSPNSPLISDLIILTVLQVGQPELKWRVSVNNNTSYNDVNSYETSTVSFGNSLYLQAYIEPNGRNFSSWKIDYSTSNPDYFFPPSSMGRTQPFTFNNNIPYDKVGRTTYSINSITFYDATGAIEDRIIYTSPQSYTLEVEKDYVPPTDPTNPVLQWTASINTRGNFIDYDKNSKLKIGENDSLFLTVRIQGGNITYSYWSFDYTITPDTYKENISRISGNRFDFIGRRAFIDFENIEVNITDLRLYGSNYQELKSIHFDVPYVFIIEKESSKIPVIEIIPTPPATQPFCTVQDKIALPFKILNADHQAQYGISFSEKALAAGFKDKTSFSNLPAGSIFEIDVPNGVSTDTYTGTINLKCDAIANLKEQYPFTFGVVNNGVEIVDQPETMQSLCGVTNIALVVDISGTSKGYQWYNGGKSISGANSRRFTAEAAGRYYLEITGECGVIKSEEIVITSSSSADGVNIKVKWGNVLYIENGSEKYQRFQWYHNGTAINGATFIYHSEKDGFLGEYYVRCYKVDGSYDETCPVVFDVRTRTSTVSIYPSVLKSNDLLNIDIQDSDLGSGATVEIYSIMSVPVYTAKISTSITTIRADIMNKGIYIVKIKLPSGEVRSEKIIVQ